MVGYGTVKALNDTLQRENNPYHGGLQGFLQQNSRVTVYIPASFPDAYRNIINSQGAKTVDIPGSRQISDFIYSTGEIDGPVTEQSLIIRSAKGLIVMTGCSHPGIVKTVKKAKALFPGDNIHLIVGGFHHPQVSGQNAESPGCRKSCAIALHRR